MSSYGMPRAALVNVSVTPVSEPPMIFLQAPSAEHWSTRSVTVPCSSGPDFQV